MNWINRLKTVLASVIFRHRVLNRWVHRMLPAKRLAAGVLVFNDAGQILLVKPSYRSYWLIPGGLVERDEPPWLAARREAKEEIGIDVGELRFIGLDWRPADDEYDDSLHFLFDGGTLAEDQIAAIKCDGTEIVDYQFAARDDVDKLLDPHLARRIIACWRGQLDRPLIMNGGKPDQSTV